MQNKTVISVENLSHLYSNGFMALNNIDLKVFAGELTAIIGQNGAGKTTLVKHLNGLLRPSAGRVMITDIDAGKEKVSTLARRVGFVFQNPDHQIFKDSVYEEVAFGPHNLGLPQQEIAARVEEALAAVNLSEHAATSPQNLSKGQRQRVALASVLAMKTEIIVLDEPTTGQDYKESLQIMDLVLELNRQGHTILFITHDMSLVARYAQRAIVLCKGEIILDGSVREVFRQADLLNKTFLHPPQIVELAALLTETGVLADGLAEGVLTPQDLFEVFKLHKRGNLDVSCS